MKRIAPLLCFTLLTGCSTLFPTTTTPKAISGDLFVVNGISNTLSKIDVKTGASSENTLSTGKVPNWFTNSKGTGFVVNSLDNNVMAFDIANNSKVGDINLENGSNPMQMALGKDGRALVTNYASGSVALLNLTDLKVEKSVPLPKRNPTSVAYADGKYYVGCVDVTFEGMTAKYGKGFVLVLKEDTLEVLKSIDVGDAANPQMISIDPQGEVNVVCTGDYSGKGKICVINPKDDTIKTTLELGGAPGSIAILSSGKAYLTDGKGGLMTYDTKEEKVLRDASSSIKVGSYLAGLATDNQKIYIADPGDYQSAGTVFVLDPATDVLLDQSWKVGTGPSFLAFRVD